MPSIDDLFNGFIEDEEDEVKRLLKKPKHKLTIAEKLIVKKYKEAIKSKDENAALVAFQEGGSLVDTTITADKHRELLLSELSDKITPTAFADKYHELLNAEHVIKDENGNVIARKADYNTQRKTLELLADVMGHKAPQKKETTSKNFNANVNGFINPDKFASAKSVEQVDEADEAARVAKEKLDADRSTETERRKKIREDAIEADFTGASEKASA